MTCVSLEDVVLTNVRQAALDYYCERACGAQFYRGSTHSELDRERLTRLAWQTAHDMHKLVTGHFFDECYGAKSFKKLLAAIEDETNTPGHGLLKLTQQLTYDFAKLKAF
jgi:hypothetical protein